MNDILLAYAHDLMTSPWIYLALFGFAAVDAFFPVVPSESLVIMAGVFAASGSPDLATVIVAAALGAVVGDHVSYFIGRRLGHVALSRLRPGTKRYAAFAWAQGFLVERGGLLLVAARYIPGGRTAATLTMGTVGYRPLLFTSFATLAATLWGTYCALVGYIGGKAFENDPIKGVVLGIGIAVTITIAGEAIRHRRRHRHAGHAETTESPTDRPTALVGGRR